MSNSGSSPGKFHNSIYKKKKHIGIHYMRLKPNPIKTSINIGENIHTWKRNTLPCSKTVWSDTSIHTIKTFNNTNF